MIAAASLLALWACGANGGTPASISPTPTGPVAVTPPPGFALVITEQDHTATMHVGQRVLVFLHARPGMNNWGPIRADDSTVLAPAVISVMAPRGVTVAAFEARAAGTATIASYAGPSCSPGQACPMYVIVFSVTVTVLAG
jgi:hypothetical protein